MRTTFVVMRFNDFAVDHTFDALVLLDGDGQHNPNEIPQLLEPIEKDTADFVIGFRALNRKTIELFQRTLAKDDFAIESEMLRTAHDEHLQLAEIKINSKYGNFDTSTKNPVSHGFSVLGSVIYLFSYCLSWDYSGGCRRCMFW